MATPEPVKIRGLGSQDDFPDFVHYNLHLKVDGI